MTMANPEMCEMVIRQMLRSYPPRMSETTTEYVASLMTVLVGKPAEIVKDLPHPESGVVKTCKFLPTVADVQEWMVPRLQVLQTKLDAERRISQQLLENHRDEPSDEDRERVLKAWQKGRDALLRKSRDHTPKQPRPIQQEHSLQELCSTRLMRD